jgi:cytochrome c556
MKVFARIAVAATLAFGIAAAGSAVAQMDPIKDRQALMKTQGGAMGQLNKFAKGEEPYDAAKAAAAAAALVGTGPKIAALFPAGTQMGGGKGETWAKAEIWSDGAKFSAAIKAFEEQAAKLAAVAATGKDPMAAQLAEVGKTCGGCHTPFRQPK